MFRPHIQKTSTLFFIALFNICMVYLAVNSETKVERLGYNYKVQAAEKMKQCLSALNQNFSFKKSELDIYNTGLYLTGGGSMLRGLDKRISQKTKLPVYVAEDPLRAVARGTGIALKNIEKFPFLIK